MGFLGRRRDRPDARQPLYLHVGVPKSGTSFLQALLAENRPRLREHGFVYPFVRPEGMFHAAVELRGQHERWGLDPALVDGTWERLLDRVRSFSGDGVAGVISHELLAGARGAEVERIARSARDLDLHVVVTVRDLPRQATAHWQEEVKNGRPWSFSAFSDELFEPSQSEQSEDGFWRMQDLTAILAAWEPELPADRLHVVVVPPSGADAGELWRRFADAVGLDPAALDPRSAPRVNESLGAAQVALLRRVVAALDGRLGQPQYAHVVKRWFAQGLLAPLPGARAVAPEPLAGRLDDVARGWVEELRRGRARVHGDLADLTPARAAGARHPDDVSAEELLEGLPQTLATMLLEVASLRSGEPGAAAGR
jgi:hypothetical protein